MRFIGHCLLTLLIAGIILEVTLRTGLIRDLDRARIISNVTDAQELIAQPTIYGSDWVPHPYFGFT
jgi:hypothetical protein